MISKFRTTLVLLLLLLGHTGCTLDSTALGVACVDDLAPFAGCFARTPAEPSLDDPEMYIQIIQEDSCHLSGHGWGLLVPYIFTSERVTGTRASLTAQGEGDAEYAERYQMSVEPTADAGGILLTVREYSRGSGGEWQSWPEPYDRPYYLERVECDEGSGE